VIIACAAVAKPIKSRKIERTALFFIFRSFPRKTTYNSDEAIRMPKDYDYDMYLN
jgi:hypothetical protein